VRGKRTMILFEGNIAAGKSTVGRRLAESGLFDFIEEPVGSWQKDFAANLLELFYKDPKRWSFTFQLAAFTTRAKTWTEVLAMTDHQNVVLERSIYCDRYVFARELVHRAGQDRLPPDPGRGLPRADRQARPEGGDEDPARLPSLARGVAR